MTVKYRQFEQKDIPETAKLIQCFYAESPGNSDINMKKIKRTFYEFTIHPEKGTVIIFEYKKTIIGYAILFKGWSNERSKDIIFIDELYVQKEFRNKGVGSGCIAFIMKEFKKSAGTIMLGVEQGNEKVEKLYKKLGFKLYKNKTFFFKL